MLQYLIYDRDIVKYRSVWAHIMPFNTDKNNNVNFEGLDIHYH
jgi:hypothetical protein